MGTSATEAMEPMTGELMEHPGDTQMLDLAKLMAAAQGERRNVRDCIKAATEIATLDIEAAEECIYKVPRGNEIKMGPSVGLAETLAACWGKMITGIDRYEIGEESIIMWGASFDLQSGMGFKGMVQRSILHKNGERYKLSVIQDTLMATQSILYRDLTLRLIPRPVVRAVYRAALALATGEGKSWTERQKNVVEFWGKRGVSEKDLLRHIGRTTRNDINVDDLEYLLALNNQVKDGGGNVEDIFSQARVKPDVEPPQAGSPKDMKEATEVLKTENEAKDVTDTIIDELGPQPPAPTDPPAKPDGKRPTEKKPTKKALMSGLENLIREVAIPMDTLNDMTADLLNAEGKNVDGDALDMNKLTNEGLVLLTTAVSAYKKPEQSELS